MESETPKKMSPPPVLPRTLHPPPRHRSRGRLHDNTDGTPFRLLDTPPNSFLKVLEVPPWSVLPQVPEGGVYDTKTDVRCSMRWDTRIVYDFLGSKSSQTKVVEVDDYGTIRTLYDSTWYLPGTEISLMSHHPCSPFLSFLFSLR